MKVISLLGATGSIGTQTLDIIAAHRDRFRLGAMSAGRNIDKTIDIIQQFQPALVSVISEDDAHRLALLFPHVRFLSGRDSLVEIALYEQSDVLLNAVIGSVGLQATLAAIRARRPVAIANKETLVTAGHIVMAEAAKYNVPLLPVDSEHSAIFQCLQGEDEKTIEKLVITASGGSFRDKTRADLVDVTVEQALAHPNWSMGAKITIDSATMMNKGLEVIEAHWLFNLPYEQIDCLLHRQSIIHSMVQFHDSSVIAQLGTPDMRVPILYALSYPERIPYSGDRLDLAKVAQLDFKAMDYERFRCLQFAYDAGKEGGSLPTVLNAANEQAVALFLNGHIRFLQIEELIERAMHEHRVISQPDLATIERIDAETRQLVQTYVQ